MLKNIILMTITIACIAGITFMIDHMPEGPVLEDPDKIQQIEKFSMVPDFTFLTLDEKVMSMNSLKGKPIILHFWATWCGPCLVEIPSLFKAAYQFQGKINVVTVSLDMNRDTLKRFLSTQEYNNVSNLYHVWDDKKKISQDLFQSYYLPETVIINAKGEMVRKVAGSAEWQGSDMINFLSDEKLYQTQ